MISISSTQIDAWLALFLWPFLRILGLMLADPFYGHRSLPRRVRAGLAVALTIMVAPLLEPMPDLAIDSAAGWAVAAQQLVIGFVLGFTMRLVFSIFDMAGQHIGLGMGLGFATFFDPQNGASTPVISQFIGVFALLIFLSINGHLMLITTLVESFRIFPIGAGFAPGGFHMAALAAGQIFAVGLILALPVIAALLIVNVAMGILTRAAPQLNIFAVGFPLTITAGFLMLLLSLPYLQPQIARLWEEGVIEGLKLIGQLRAP